MPDIAVLLPEEEQFKKVFEAISKLCQQLGFNAKRVKALVNLEDPNVEEIKNSVAIIADISRDNFYTAVGIGVSLAQGKLLIPITEKEEHKSVGKNVIVYSPQEEGLRKFQRDIYRTLKDHRSLIKEDVRFILKRRETSYGRLKVLKNNEQGYREFELVEEGLVFIEVPGGPFLYGEGNRREEEETFLIGKYLLTNRQWNSFLEKTDYNWKGHWLGRPKGRLKRVAEFPEEMANYPIVDISFIDMEHYVKWLNEKYGDKDIYFTIPTEKQWEKAARGTDGRRFPWGNEVPNHELALYEQDLRHGTAPVDSFEKGVSPYGCYHMAGNVFEWTYSFYPFDYKSRVVRGGSYAIEPMELACYVKFSRRPEIGHWTSGGRIATLIW